MKHEARCKKNPANDRPCFYCCHLRKEERDVSCYSCCDDDIYHYNARVLVCTKRGTPVYPPSVSAKGNALDIEDNEPMPLTCKDYKGFYESKWRGE